MLANILTFLVGLFNLFIDVIHYVVKSLLLLVLVGFALTIGFTTVLILLLR